MKITPLQPYTTHLLDKEGRQSSQQQKQDSQKKDQPPEQKVSAQLKKEHLQQTIEEWKTDIQNHQHPLQISQIGQGPGLKIVLKNASGSVIRELSGEEFIKLRETAQQDHKQRGKILDQKL